MDSRLTSSDIDMLLDALDVLKKQDAQDTFMAGMLGSMIAPAGERDKVLSEMEKDLEEQREKSKALKRRITLVKAKLIEMQDDMDVNEYIRGISE